MHNNDILKKLIEMYGLEQALEYCKMNAYVYGLMNEGPNNSQELKYEYSYQFDWWKNAIINLKNSLQYENGRTDIRVS